MHVRGVTGRCTWESARGRLLPGLGLVDVVVFPHRDQPGRAERIARSIERFGHAYRLHPLGDDELLIFVVE